MSPDLLLLAALFFGAAVLYASVGFGGGSAYLALLTLSTIPLPHAASIALVCNVIVVTGGTWHFVRAGHFRAGLVLPFLVTSVPAAYLGGRWPLDLAVLQFVTAGALAAAAVVMIFSDRNDAAAATDHLSTWQLWGIALPLGGLLGGLAGLIGIGGGIFLAPVLHLMNWSTAKQVAMTASLFILVNSVAALAGRIGTLTGSLTLAPYALLFAAVLVGGQIGSRLGARRLSPRWVRRLTALVLLIAAAHLATGR